GHVDAERPATPQPRRLAREAALRLRGAHEPARGPDPDGRVVPVDGHGHEMTTSAHAIDTPRAALGVLRRGAAWLEGVRPLKVLVLMPIAFFCAYGIGERIGGRLFGYWTAALWIVVPLIGIKYADAGYHQRYTELLLPQSYGLSVMSDFPAMVVLAAAAYFT